jgi:hypothetical protein
VFDLNRFIEDCRAAVREDSSHKAVREVLARANSDSAAILAAIGEPARAGVTPLYKFWGLRTKGLAVSHEVCAYADGWEETRRRSPAMVNIIALLPN